LIASLVFLAAGLLAWGGGAKIWKPDATVRSLTASGVDVPRPRATIRILGVVEVSVGLSCLLALGPAAPAALAALYLAFALYIVWLVVRRVPAATCGCFGQRDTQPSVLHVFVDLVAVGAGVAAVFEPVPSIGSALGALPLYGVPFVAGVFATGYLIALAETYLPTLFFSYRRSSAP
jgi:uncharacterized membrane protein YphA (DoxX/SURF4 family)